MKSEKEKMVSGETYNPANPRLVLDRARANRICTKYNKKCFNEIIERTFLLENTDMQHPLRQHSGLQICMKI